MAMYKVSPAVTAKTQPLSSCCWLTCLEMLFVWKKKDSSGILEAMDKSPDLFPYYMKNNGIAPWECKETAKMLGLKAGSGDIEAEVLESCLKTHGPMWIAGDWVEGSMTEKEKAANKADHSHVIVVTACDAAADKIKYINPWNNHDLSESNGTVSWLTKRADKWKNCTHSVMYW